MTKPAILGVDIGGSHITAALVDPVSGYVITSSLQRADVDSRASAATILLAWSQIISLALSDVSKLHTSIGIAMPGPFDYENGISLIKEQDKFRSLYGMNIKEELAKYLATSPDEIRFINDAASFLQGEMYSGAAKGYKNAIGLTLGTGLGSAIAKNGKANDAALWKAPFLSGIAEDYFSTRWFVSKYKSLTDRHIEGVKELAEIVESDPFARQIFNEFGRGLAHFLADIIRANKAEVVVLGGNIAQAYPLFESHLISGLQAYHIDIPITVSLLNENAALIGASSLWNTQDQEIFI